MLLLSRVHSVYEVWFCLIPFATLYLQLWKDNKTCESWTTCFDMSSVSSPISIDLESISIDLRVSGPFPPAEIPVDLEKVIVSNSWCEDPPNVPNAELPRADGTLGRETRGIGFEWIVSSRKRLRSFLLREVLSSKTAELRLSSKTAQLTTVIKDCLVESCLKWSSH